MASQREEDCSDLLHVVVELLELIYAWMDDTVMETIASSEGRWMNIWKYGRMRRLRTMDESMNSRPHFSTVALCQMRVYLCFRQGGVSWYAHYILWENLMWMHWSGNLYCQQFWWFRRDNPANDERELIETCHIYYTQRQHTSIAILCAGDQSGGIWPSRRRPRGRWKTCHYFRVNKIYVTIFLQKQIATAYCLVFGG